MFILCFCYIDDCNNCCIPVITVISTVMTVIETIYVGNKSKIVMITYFMKIV